MTPFDDDAGTTFLPRGWADQAAPSSDPIGHYLVAIGGTVASARVEVSDTPVTIGRSPSHTLVLAGDSDVSRMHARVSLVNGSLVAEDLGSTNGTFVEGERLTRPTTMIEGNVLRIGRQLLKYERRSRKDVERSKDLDRDLLKASKYVHSLLPPPLQSGPVRVDWRFVPCAQLGGDAFGYYWLDPATFVFYLFDVSGHGVGSAMHSVTVMNVLRQRALPQVDFGSPSDVLANLNARFSMEEHNGLFFTMWYGVYRTDTRRLEYSSAGHHPAYVVSPDGRAAHPLGESALMIGAMPDVSYDVQQTTLPAGAVLYLFSDGVFEIATTDEHRWALSDFLPLLETASTGAPEPERLYHTVRAAARPGPLDDDFSLIALTFP